LRLTLELMDRRQRLSVSDQAMASGVADLDANHVQELDAVFDQMEAEIQALPYRTVESAV